VGLMLRCSELGAQIKRGRTAIYDDVKAGLLPPPIKIGARSVAWLQDEITSVLNARIAGKGESEIKALVSQLVAERRNVG